MKKDLKESADADLETTIVCGSSYFFAAAADAAVTETAMTAVCGSSCFSFAAAVVTVVSLETMAVAVSL